MQIKDGVYGQQEIIEPVILEILDTPPLIRLKHINQAGTNMVQTEKLITRWDHCVGDMLLLKRYGASLEEQIAGLLHDVPHTAFSHTVDFAFKEGDSQGYHDRFLKKIVFDSPIPDILKKYHLDASRVTDESNFSLQEQELPTLCADRIDYSLRDMVEMNNITPGEISQILDSITTYQGRFVMGDKETALLFARKYMQQCLLSWNLPLTLATHELLGEWIATALKDGTLVEKDLFLTDSEVWEKLQKSVNSRTEKYAKLLTPDLKIQLNDNDYEIETRGKARYIDPDVKTPDGLKKLSTLDKSYRSEINGFLEKTKKGLHIRILSKY